MRPEMDEFEDRDIDRAEFWRACGNPSVILAFYRNVGAAELTLVELKELVRKLEEYAND